MAIPWSQMTPEQQAQSKQQSTLAHITDIYSRGGDEQKFRDSYQQLMGSAPTDMPDRYAKTGGDTGAYVAAPNFDAYEGYTGTISGTGNNAATTAGSMYGGYVPVQSQNIAYAGDPNAVNQQVTQQAQTAANEQRATGGVPDYSNLGSATNNVQTGQQGQLAPTGMQMPTPAPPQQGGQPANSSKTAPAPEYSGGQQGGQQGGSSKTAPAPNYTGGQTQTSAPQQTSAAPQTPVQPQAGGNFQAQKYNDQQLQRDVDFSDLQNLDASGGYNPEFGQTQYDRQMSLRGPQMERDRASLETRLRNQGLRPGTEAYDNAMGDLQDQQGEEMSRMSQDAMRLGAEEQQRQFGRELSSRGQGYQEVMAGGNFYNQAANQALMQQLGIGSQEFNEMLGAGQFGESQRAARFNEQMAGGNQSFSQQMQLANYQNQLRQQAIAEEAQRRGMSINEMNALISGQQVQNPSMPQFSQSSAADPTNYLGAATQQGNFDLGGSASNPMNQMMGGLGGSLGSGIGSGIAGMFF